MPASLLIVFREVLEAGLILGIVLAATQGVAHRLRWIGGGVAAGILCAIVVAVFAGALSETMAGMGQEVFNASILGLAVLMLGWHTFWMSRHTSDLTSQMNSMGRSVAAGEKPLLALALVVAVAVLREGSEVVLFLYGIAASNQDGPAPLLAGGLLGVIAGAAVSWLLYRGLVTIPMRHLFAVMNWLIALLAAGMAGQAVAYLAGAEILPSWGDSLWDSSMILSEKSIAGRALHALIGYSDRPPGIQVVAYLLTLVAMLMLGKLAAGGKRPAGKADAVKSVAFSAGE